MLAANAVATRTTQRVAESDSRKKPAAGREKTHFSFNEEALVWIISPTTQRDCVLNHQQIELTSSGLGRLAILRTMGGNAECYWPYHVVASQLLSVF